MLTVEFDPVVDSPEFNESFNTHPPIPCGYAEISDLALIAMAGEEPSEPGYAWERMVLRFFHEANLTTHAIGDKKLISELDICSSNPILSEYKRANQFARSGLRARDIANDLFSSNSTRALKEESFYLSAANTVLAKDKVARGLLQAALQECLYQITTEEWDAEKPERAFYHRLRDKLFTQTHSYNVEQSTRNMETRWQIYIEPEEHGQTYFERLCQLSTLTAEAHEAKARMTGEDEGSFCRIDDMTTAQQREAAGEQLAAELLERQVAAIAQEVVGNPRYRPIRIFSMDNAAPLSIATSSIINTPASTQEMTMFSRATESLFNRHQHITGNMFNALPVPDDSLALITCIDGWPFHFQLDPEKHVNHEEFVQVAIDVLKGWYDKLAPGGKILIFPWAIYNPNDSHSDKKAHERSLKQVCEGLGDAIGHGVDSRRFSRGTLYEWMSVADRETADRISPIFKSNDTSYEALMITKPRESSMRTVRKTGKVAIKESQSPD